MRQRAIACGKGIGDAAMRFHEPRWSGKTRPVMVENLFERRVKQQRHRLACQKQHGVARRLGDDGVELDVEVDDRLHLAARFFHGIDIGMQPFDLSGRDAAGGVAHG